MPATHLDFGIVGRTRTGRVDRGSAVAASAYNLCGQLVTTEGKAFDFSRKATEHVAGDVLLPAGAPPALLDPGTLWQAAEMAERRSDAQLARQILVTLPRECPPEYRLALARHIAAPWVSDGMGVQLDIHCTGASDGAEQPHVHYLATLRRVTDAGLAATKERKWNTLFREGEGRGERQRIADRANQFFASHGLAARIEARSLTDQGEQRTPEPSARRQDWQRWIRDGGEPDQAPPPVAAVLQHRRRRSSLAVTTAMADQAAAEVADLVEQLAALPVPAAPAKRIEEAPSPTLTGIAGRAAHVRPPTPTQEATMPRPAQRPASRRDIPRPIPRIEPWARQEGGFEALSDALQHAARRSYDEWRRRKPQLAQRHDLAEYVQYVQDRQTREAERARLATEAPGVPVPALPDGVAPATGAVAHRAEHLARVLADEAPRLPAGWRSKVYADAGLTRIWPPGMQEHIIDRGDRLEPGGQITPALAAATVQIAADRGWTTLTLTGDEAYRDAIAIAAALHRPPIPTDHALSKPAAEQVAQQLRERAQPAALDTAAVAQLAAIDPAAAARRVLDHAEAKARAGLTGKPTGSTDPAELAAPRVAALAAARDQAREDRHEAAAALAAHAASYSWGNRLLDPAVRQRHAAMRAESDRLTRHSLTLDAQLGTATRKVHIAAEREARKNRTAQDDWRWSKPVRQAEASLAQLAAVRAAVEAGSPDAIAAAARGDLRAAAKAAATWQAAPAAGPADPRTSAVRSLAAAEQQHATDPQALARARVATAAAVAGDAATIAAAGSGDPAAIARAAQAWQEEQARQAREQREERARQLTAAAARTPQEPAQPTL